MKNFKYLLIILSCVSISITCFSQETSQNFQTGYDYGINLDTINCNHFKMAHNILTKEGLRKFSSVIDYPILEYIAKNKKCTNLNEHGIGEQDLNYSIYTIITFEEEN